MLKKISTFIIFTLLAGCGGGKEPNKIGESCPSGLVLTEGEPKSKTL